MFAKHDIATLNMDGFKQSGCCLILLLTCLLISIRYVYNQCPPISSAMYVTRMELHKDIQLVGHQIRSIADVTSITHCGLLCAVDESCVSFNYGIISSECQLNDANWDVFPCHLMTSNQFSHYKLSNNKVINALIEPSSYQGIVTLFISRGGEGEGSVTIPYLFYS